MDKEKFIELFEALSDRMKKEYLAFIRYLQDTEDNGEPRPASQE